MDAAELPAASESGTDFDGLDKPFKYNQLLPYAAEIEQEASEYSRVILNGISESVTHSELNGLSFWLNKLKTFFVLHKNALPLKRYISVIHLLYSLVIDEDNNIDCVPQLHAVEILTNLLANKEFLPNNSLVLGWKPLYDIVESQYLSYSFNGSKVVSKEHGALMFDLIEEARRFFPKETTRELLAIVKPNLCIHYTTLFFSITALSMFLPTTKHNTEYDLWAVELFEIWKWKENNRTWNLAFIQLYQRLFVDNFGNLNGGKSTINKNMDSISTSIGNINKNNDINNNNNNNENNKQVFHINSALAVIFNHILVFLKLPVGGGGQVATPQQNNFPSALVSLISRQTNKSHSGLIANTCRVIVYTIKKDTDTLKYLKNLIFSIKSFYHPSNIGGWTPSLSRFLQSLCYEVTKRVKLEQNGKCKYDASVHGLTLDQIEEFVDIVLPMCVQALFSKHYATIALASKALQWLCHLNPNKVIPVLLNRIYPALETLTESHQTLPSILALSSISVPLVRRSGPLVLNGNSKGSGSIGGCDADSLNNKAKAAAESGDSTAVHDADEISSQFPFTLSPSSTSGYLNHVFLLLELTLPGIDSNDIQKTLFTLKFYISLFSSVPIVDCSGNIEAIQARRRKAMEIETDEDKNCSGNNSYVNVDANGKETGELSEDELQVLSRTADFESWSLAFLDRIFTWFENFIPAKERSKSSYKRLPLEASLPEFIGITSLLMFSQMSADIHKTCATRIFRFVTSKFLLPAQKPIGLLCSSLSSSQPEATLKIFMPLITKRVLENALQHIECDEEDVDRELIWDLHMLGQLVKRTGVHLLPYMDTIKEILVNTMKSPSRKIIKLSMKLMKNVLRALSLIYPMEFCSLSKEDYENASTLGLDAWGKWYRIEDVDVAWHIPTEQEYKCALDLIQLLLPSPAAAIL